MHTDSRECADPFARTTNIWETPPRIHPHTVPVPFILKLLCSALPPLFTSAFTSVCTSAFTSSVLLLYCLFHSSVLLLLLDCLSFVLFFSQLPISFLFTSSFLLLYFCLTCASCLFTSAFFILHSCLSACFVSACPQLLFCFLSSSLLLHFFLLYCFSHLLYSLL